MSGAMASRIAQLLVVDVLFVLVARADLDRTTMALKLTFDAVQGKKVHR